VRSIQRLSLKAQLRRAALLTTLVALLLSAVSLLAYEWQQYRRGWVDDLRTQADLIAHASEAALVFDDPRSAKENLALLWQRRSIRYAAVLRADGRPFAEYIAPGAQREPPMPTEERHGGGHRFAGNALTLTYPVLHDGEWIGTVVLRARHDVWARIATYAGIELAATAGALALAALVFGRLQRAVTTPLARMTEVAREVIARRDFRLRAPEEAANADVALLVEAFNRMLAEVQARTAELEHEMAERVRAEDELRQADRRKDEFLATLGHELRNPLAPMSNAVALLRLRRQMPEATDKAVEILDRQLRQISRLIDDLLDVSRITRGKLLLATEPLDLAALLRNVAETMAPMAEAAGLRFEAQVPDTPCRVAGDGARLSQVLSNLLNNAFRYTPAGGRVALRLTQPEPGWAEVRVEDNGIGIPAELQERVFEMFEQGDKRLERGNTGLGIGLTLARQLARLHGGDIRVHSDGAGRGATFVVRMPTAEPAAVQPPSPASAARVAAPLHLLIADDNVDFALSLQSLLKAAGHDVQVVHDGEAALAAARREPPDAAVLDIGMPGLNGYELARRLRADPRTAAIRLIAATGWGQASDRQSAAEAGFDHHLVKPVRAEQLLALLAQMFPCDAAQPPHAIAKGE
jgi:signal transduction histidine kinase/ActR/RegA family two-component response regulator